MALRIIEGIIRLRDEASSQVEKLRKGMDEAKKAATDMQNIMEAIGGYETIKHIADFGKEISGLAADEEKVNASVKALSGAGYGELKESIESSTKAAGGFVNEIDFSKSIKPALEMGASIEFISKNMSDVQKLSAIAGDDTETMMRKLTMFAETGNAKMLKTIPILSAHREQLAHLSKLTGEYGKAAREAALSKIIDSEKLNLAKEYNEAMNTMSAQSQKLDKGIEESKKIWGELLNKALKPIVSVFADVVHWLTSTERGMAWLKIAGILLAGVAGVILVTAFYMLAASVWAAIAPLLPFIAIALGLVAALTFVGLAIEDIWVYLHGGKSLIGYLIDHFGEWSKHNKVLAATLLQVGAVIAIVLAPIILIIAGVKAAITVFKNWDKIVDYLTKRFKAFLQSIRDVSNSVKHGFKSFFGMDDDKKETPTPQGHASGGYVSAGTPYMVGERGPELFTPGSSGNITPNNRLGGGVSIASIVGSMTFNVSGGAEAAQQVKVAVMNALDELARGTFRAQLGMPTS